MIYVALVVPGTLAIADWQEKTLSAFHIIIPTAPNVIFIIKPFVFYAFLVYIANDFCFVRNVVPTFVDFTIGANYKGIDTRSATRFCNNSCWIDFSFQNTF